MQTPNDIYASITQKIINDLEKGLLPWRKAGQINNPRPFAPRPLLNKDTTYPAINILLLWAAAADKGYVSPYWFTYNQARDLKAHVRQGETSSKAVFLETIIKEEREDNGKTNIQKILQPSLYSVFNAGQIDGLPEEYYKVPDAGGSNKENPVENIENFFKKTRASICPGKKAAYSEKTDRIEMPPLESFNDVLEYYNTLAQEVTHWTRHPSRLNRNFNRKKWGEEEKAKEALVTELATCFLAADLGFEPTPLDQQANIEAWLKILKNDSKFIFQAASQAQKAVEYMNTLEQPTSKTKKEKEPALTI